EHLAGVGQFARLSEPPSCFEEGCAQRRQHALEVKYRVISVGGVALPDGKGIVSLESAKSFQGSDGAFALYALRASVRQSRVRVRTDAARGGQLPCEEPRRFPEGWIDRGGAFDQMAETVKIILNLGWVSGGPPQGAFRFE